MTIADALTEFADQLTDALSPPGTDAPAGELAGLFATPSRTGADDGSILAVMVELTRLLNLTTTALAETTDAAERAGIPFRKGLRTASDLLKQLGLPPAVAIRLARVGRAASGLPEVSRQTRIGGMAIENVDAIGQGVAFVDRRVPLDDDAKRDLARRLAAQTTPAEVANRARELAIAWAPAVDADDPDSIPVAESPELNEMTIVTGRDGRTTANWEMDALTGEELNQAVDALSRPVPQPDGSRDPRSAKQRRADAIAQVIREFLAGRDRPTSSGGVLPHVTLIVPTRPRESEVLGSESAERGRSPVASLGFTGPVSASTVGLVVCEAAMRRVVMDADSAPLDVGREQRLVPVALRKALEARDRGCAFPGCGRPVSWTDAHHCTPWSEGGETAIDNCVLLCRMHHTAVHQAGWEVFIGHDRHPWFRPPRDAGHPGRFREPIRSNAQRTLTAEPTAAA